MAKTIQFDEWLRAPRLQQVQWIKEKVRLDSVGQDILSWSQLFRRHGGRIKDKTMLLAWKELKRKRK